MPTFIKPQPLSVVLKTGMNIYVAHSLPQVFRMQNMKLSECVPSLALSPRNLHRDCKRIDVHFDDVIDIVALSTTLYCCTRKERNCRRSCGLVCRRRLFNMALGAHHFLLQSLQLSLLCFSYSFSSSYDSLQLTVRENLSPSRSCKRFPPFSLFAAAFSSRLGCCRSLTSP